MQYPANKNKNKKNYSLLIISYTIIKKKKVLKNSSDPRNAVTLLFFAGKCRSVIRTKFLSFPSLMYFKDCL